MIIASQLPQLGIKITDINPSELFPFHAESSVDSPFYVCNDGSLVVFFEFSQLDFQRVHNVLGVLSPSSKLQLYKLKAHGKERYFGCVKLWVDYSPVKLRFAETLKYIFCGGSRFVDAINESTQKIVNSINEALKAKVRFVPVHREGSALYEYLVDCSVQSGELRTRLLPLGNMSVIKTADNRFCTMVSLNNVHGLNCTDILCDYEYLQYFSVCVPSIDYGGDLDKYFSRTFNMLELLDTKNYDTEKLNFCDKGDKYVFTHTSFILTASTANDVIRQSESFCKTLSDNGIVTFEHTNSAAMNYVSCFPGNAEKGYHYQINYADSVKQMLRGYFAL